MYIILSSTVQTQQISPTLIKLILHFSTAIGFKDQIHIEMFCIVGLIMFATINI